MQDIPGSGASRAGNGITVLPGRALGIFVVNLGFSGAAGLAPEIQTETDSSCCIIDPLPNCDTLLVEERLEEFLRKLCTSCPEVPVVFLTDADRRNAWIFPGSVRAHQEKRAAAKRVVAVLQREYSSLDFIDMARSMGSGFEGIGDGILPDELGVVCFSSYLIRKLRALKLF